jgi:hypothetical protein
LIRCEKKILLNGWLADKLTQTGQTFHMDVLPTTKRKKRSILSGKNLQPAPGIPSHVVISRACSAEAISKRQYFVKKR